MNGILKYLIPSALFGGVIAKANLNNLPENLSEEERETGYKVCITRGLVYGALAPLSASLILTDMWWGQSLNYHIVPTYPNCDFLGIPYLSHPRVDCRRISDEVYEEAKRLEIEGIGIKLTAINKPYKGRIELVIEEEKIHT